MICGQDDGLVLYTWEHVYKRDQVRVSLITFKQTVEPTTAHWIRLWAAYYTVNVSRENKDTSQGQIILSAIYCIFEGAM